MKVTRQRKVPPAKQLGILAMQFRGTRDKLERAAIARAYCQAVAHLIDGNKKKWTTMPPLEDQLPDDWMPREFFIYWSLTPPKR